MHPVTAYAWLCQTVQGRTLGVTGPPPPTHTSPPCPKQENWRTILAGEAAPVTKLMGKYSTCCITPEPNHTCTYIYMHGWGVLCVCVCVCTQFTKVNLRYCVLVDFWTQNKYQL